jgi:hypothetical protein
VGGGLALAAPGDGGGAQEPPPPPLPAPRPRSNVVRPRRTNRGGARRHDNCSLRRGRPAALSLRSRWPGAAPPRGVEAARVPSWPVLETWKSVAKMHSPPRVCNDDTAFQGGFSAFGTETQAPLECLEPEPWSQAEAKTGSATSGP